MPISAHELYVLDDSGHQTTQFLAAVKPASEELVKLVLSKDEKDLDGRSPWVWVRLQNGDLILGVFPQGATYFDCEVEAP